MNTWMNRGLFALALCAPLAACAAEDGADDPSGEAGEGMVSEADAGASGIPPREGPEGCYVPSMMRCDCDVTEADCAEPNLWTEGCASCAQP